MNDNEFGAVSHSSDEDTRRTSSVKTCVWGYLEIAQELSTRSGQKPYLTVLHVNYMHSELSYNTVTTKFKPLVQQQHTCLVIPSLRYKKRKNSLREAAFDKTAGSTQCIGRSVTRPLSIALRSMSPQDSTQLTVYGKPKSLLIPNSNPRKRLLVTATVRDPARLDKFA